MNFVCGATPEHPWVPRKVDCNLDCLREEIRRDKVGVSKKRVEYPLWYLCLYNAMGKSAKTIEKSIIDFICDMDSKTKIIEHSNGLGSLLLTYMCNYYQLDLSITTIKKTSRFMLEKRALRPNLCIPTGYEAVQEKKEVITPKDQPLVVNIIVYDNEDDEKTMILHLTNIKEVITDTLNSFLRRIKFNCRQDVINKSNILLFFEDEESLDYAIERFRKMDALLIRDDLLRPEEKEEIVLKNEDNTFTDVALRIISGMLSEKFSRDVVGKIMMEMPAYHSQILSNYNTTWKFLKEDEQPLLTLELKTPDKFILKEMYVQFKVNRTQINQIVGYHDDILTFDLDMYIGVGDKKVKVKWVKNIGEGGKFFNYHHVISDDKEVSMLRRKKLDVQVVYHNKNVIGHRANVNFFFEARFLPLIPKKKDAPKTNSLLKDDKL